MADYNLSPQIFDVTNWIEKKYVNTGGTREKSYLESDNGDAYFFKTSLKKPGKDYKYEFWSEIIASKLGLILGLNILQYDIAIKGNKIGCLSKSMIKQDGQRLTEGVNYLVGFNFKYDPSAKEDQHLYSYQNITAALKFFDIDRFIDNIDEIIVFDAIIGNGDRHQENWAIISEYTPYLKNLSINVDEPFNFFKNGLKKIRNAFLGASTHEIQEYKENEVPKSTKIILQNFLDNNISFAPIYDSGSSLAREHSDEKLLEILHNDVRMNSYISKGKSEIHWNGNKLNHYELIGNLLTTSQKIRKTIDQFTSRFNEELIREMIFNIDNDVPDGFNDIKLSDTRKEFLTKMITLRFNIVKGL